MEQEQGQEPTPSPNEIEQETPAPPAQEPPAPPAPQKQPPKPQEGDEDELPAWARREMKNLRDEAADRRVKLRDEQAKWEGGLTADEAKELRNQIRELEARDVAAQSGLPIELASRLQGDTAEEMRADAQKLVESLPLGNRSLRGGLNPSDADDDTSDEVKQRIQRMRQRRY